MLEKLKKLQELINGTEAELFLEFYYGKYFTGSMTITEDSETGTLYFHKGEVYRVESGIPIEGVDIGVSGTKSGWDAFDEVRKSLTCSASRPDVENKGQSKRLVVLGGTIRVRQNWNALAQVARLYSCLG